MKNSILILSLMVLFSSCREYDSDDINCSYEVTGVYTGTKVYNEQAGYTDTTEVTVQVTQEKDLIVLDAFPNFGFSLQNCVGVYDESGGLGQNEIVEVEFFQDSLVVYHGQPFSEESDKTWFDYYLVK